MPQVVPLSADTGDAPWTPVDPGRVVDGQPRQAVANAWSDPSEAFHCGVWAGGPGAWRVRYTEHEFCHVLSGALRIGNDQGASWTFVAGDSFVVPAGFSGTWEVLEETEKLYAIFDASAA